MSAIARFPFEAPSTATDRRHREVSQRIKRAAEDQKPTRTADKWGLVRSELAGDSKALSELFTSHHTRLYHTAFLLLSNREDAKDALQDALVSAYVGLGSFRGRAASSTWLTRIVMNAALISHRKLRARPQRPLDELVEDDGKPAEGWGSRRTTWSGGDLLPTCKLRRCAASDKRALAGTAVSCASKGYTTILDKGRSKTQRCDHGGYQGMLPARTPPTRALTGHQGDEFLAT